MELSSTASVNSIDAKDDIDVRDNDMDISSLKRAAKGVSPGAATKLHRR